MLHFLYSSFYLTLQYGQTFNIFTFSRFIRTEHYIYFLWSCGGINSGLVLNSCNSRVTSNRSVVADVNLARLKKWTIIIIIMCCANWQRHSGLSTDDCSQCSGLTLFLHTTILYHIQHNSFQSLSASFNPNFSSHRHVLQCFYSHFNQLDTRT